MCGFHDEHPAHDGGRPHRSAGATGYRHRRGLAGLAGRTRRAFLGDVGRGAVALALFTPIVAACSSDGEDSAGDGAATGTAGTGGDTAGEQSTTTAAAGTTTTATGTAGELRWGQANLGFVSAYVLARGDRAAIVDTGTAGSADAIGQTLQDLGLRYADVDHVVLTHHHGDHAGSINEVLAAAGSATVYAGAEDLARLTIAPGGNAADPDTIVALDGGEDVFGFEMLATPGHTAGHMAVIDHAAGLLVAGDAIFTDGGAVIEGPERFFEDVERSRDTIRSLADLSYNTLLVGNGAPIESGADAAVAVLADSLP
ncbi:MAG: MBL fold metallo-hydrolase [Actinomycetota bacterium]